MSEAEVRIRPARPSDAGPMVALINTYAAEDRMLERSESLVLANLADFLVAERDGTFRG